MIRYALPLASRTELKAEYHQQFPRFQRVVEALRDRVEEGLEASRLRGTVKCRVKSFDSLYEKLLRKLRGAGTDSLHAPVHNHNHHEDPHHSSPDYVEITDLLGLRIVCPFLSDAGRAETFIEETFTVLEKERKGVPGNGATFGYASTHYLCEVPDDLADEDCDAFEVQVRTILQDAWAEVEHELIYKSEDTPLNEPAKRKLAALNASLTLADMVFEEIRDSQRRLQSQLTQRRQDFMDRVAGTLADSPPDLLPPEEIIPGAEDIDAMLLKGLQYHNAKDFDRAVETYTDILKGETRSFVRSVVFMHRGMANFARSEYEAAIEDFTNALALDDDNWKALYYRGVIYRSTGRLEEALADLNKCVSLDIYRYESLLARAELLLQMGNHPGARRDAKRALRLEPESEDATRLLAKAGEDGRESE
ncbi:MAG: tetratricopeptide repeat protein [Spirochaetes bacterium]|jgi:putative GTP pyrophosphokinase|nr:tetratricopeptide repeat protein [Spirochaetota bacterium]